MKYKINSTVKTLKKVWNVLKECNLDGLLSGNVVEIKINEVLDILLNEGKLNEVCQIITGETIDFEELDFEEVLNIPKTFFGNIVRVCQGSGITMPVVQEKTKKQKS